MGAITQTSRGSITQVARTTLTTSDTFTYVPNTNQVLALHNNTAGSITATIKGSAPSAAFPVPGAGNTTVDLSAGKAVVVGVSQTFYLALDSIANYLAGNGTVTVTSTAGGITATLLSN